MLDTRTRGALRDLRRKAGDAARALLTREIRIEFERIPLPVRNASLRKVRNWLAVEAGIALRRTEPWGLPTHAQIEPSSRCNLRCTYAFAGGNYTDVVADTWFFPENAVGAATAPRPEPSARPDVAGELPG